MTVACGNCGVIEMRINGTPHARRNCLWQSMTVCDENLGNPVICVCAPDINDYANIPLIHWVSLPAGINTIEVYGVRIGRSSLESQTEVAVCRESCPPIKSNVTCIPAAVIAEQGLCEFERLAALYSAMVGCLEVAAQCSQAPDTYIADLFCLEKCTDGCELDEGCIVQDPPLPGGGVLMNTIVLNYPYDIKIRIDWHTAIVQDFIGGCDVGLCP